nr:unnamed protein product [Digitaria exilis]
MASSQCCDNPPALNPAGGEGKVVDSFGGLKAYVAGSEDAKAAVVLVADEKGFEDAKPVIAALKEKGISAIGAAGYCWGAKVVVELAKAHDIQAAVLLHPSFVAVDDIKEVKCPISILGAEIDKMSPPELVKQFELVLSANSGVAHFVKIFPGVSHGWSVRYSLDDAAAVKSAEEALADMIDWFNKNLK